MERLRDIQYRRPARLGMITPPQTAARTQRMRNLSTTMIVSQIVLASEMQRFASRARTYLEENGMYRQRAKAACKELMTSTIHLQADVDDAEKKMLLGNYTMGFPYYQKAYDSEGYTVSKSLQSSLFYDSLDSPQMLFDAYNAMFERNGVGHSELFANLFMVTALTRVGEQVGDTLYQDLYETEHGRVTHEKYKMRMIKRIQKAAENVIAALPKSKIDIEEEEKQELSAHAKKIASDLVGEEAMVIYIRSTQATVYSYIEYCMASMLLEERSGGLNEEVRALLMEIFYDEFPDNLLRELDAVEIPEDADAVDVIDLIPDSEEGKPVWEFRRVMLDRLPTYVGSYRVNKNIVKL